LHFETARVVAEGRFIHTGNLVLDLVLQLRALPERGGDVVATSTTAHAGGAFNAMAAAARQGVSVTYAGALGTGPNATILEHEVADESIALAQARVSGNDSGFVVVMVDGEGERTFVTSRGAEVDLRPDELASIPVAHDDIVLVSGYTLVGPGCDALMRWLGMLHPAVAVVFDPGPLVEEIDHSVLDRVIARSTWITCNEREARMLTGLESSADAAAALVRRSVGQGAVVRMGAEGCRVCLAGSDSRGAADGPGVESRATSSVLHIAGFAVRPIDTNGAGDAHTGVFIACLLQGMQPPDALQRANAAAAISVTRSGPATCPSPAEIDALLARHAFA